MPVHLHRLRGNSNPLAPNTTRTEPHIQVARRRAYQIQRSILQTARTEQDFTATIRQLQQSASQPKL